MAIGVLFWMNFDERAAKKLLPDRHDDIHIVVR